MVFPEKIKKAGKAIFGGLSLFFILGCVNQEIIKKPGTFPRIWAMLHPSENSALVGNVERHFEDINGYGLGPVEFSYITPDGNLINWSREIFVPKIKGGKIHGYWVDFSLMFPTGFFLRDRNGDSYFRAEDGDVWGKPKYNYKGQIGYDGEPAPAKKPPILPRRIQ